MSKITRRVKVQREMNRLASKGAVKNFMGGISYEINPLDTLKMVTASSIFGEPSYYRDGEFSQAKVKDSVYGYSPEFIEYDLFADAFMEKTTSQIMEEVIDKSLSYDFGATLDWAVTLRKDYLMRLNPQVIMVRAAIHPDRVSFNNDNPGKFAEVEKLVMSRADEPSSQLAYYLYKNDGKKNNIPNVLKRAWANKLSSLTAYEVNKYKNTGLGIIDAVRISHANSEVLDKLLKGEDLGLSQEELTWETLRSQGKNWKEIYETVKMGHMALLRNLRGIFTEVEDVEFCEKVLENLKAGVLKGKQFPFRYYSAMKMIKSSNVNHKSLILDALQECIDISLENMPKLKGKTMCLSDNSGSAWRTFNSEYGTVTVAEIDNLSSVITAANSQEGYVGKFGDELLVSPVFKRDGVLTQASEISKSRGLDVGASTENGIWIFFKNAIDNKEHWDNIFIYSDMQAGHGGLYGTTECEREYSKRGFSVKGRGQHIDVAKLIDVYRKTVNPKVNVFCVQTAGYNNVCVPEYGYRTNILYGWTGKELIFADEMNKLWDELDSKNKEEK